MVVGYVSESMPLQPMALEEVLSAEDSEAEVDEEIAAIEDRRVKSSADQSLRQMHVCLAELLTQNAVQILQLLDEFVDVQPDEKELMHMWNCFVSKQR